MSNKFIIIKNELYNSKNNKIKFLRYFLKIKKNYKKLIKIE